MNLSDIETLIAELEWRLYERQSRIDSLSKIITRSEQRLPYLSVVERYIQRQVIDSHKRTITSLKGWQTRDQKRLDDLKKKLPPPEERVSDEECSGMDIYYNTDTKKYVIRDPNTKEQIRIEEKICMEVTASITTSEGHDVPVVVEITCTTYVKEMTLSELIAEERKVVAELFDWLIDQGWENLLKSFEKVGAAYNGENHIEKKGWYTWTIPDYPDVYVFVEKKEPTRRTYTGEFTV